MLIHSRGPTYLNQNFIHFVGPPSCVNPSDQTGERDTDVESTAASDGAPGVRVAVSEVVERVLWWNRKLLICRSVCLFHARPRETR